MPDQPDLVTLESLCILDRCTHKGTYKMSGRCSNCGTEPIVGTFSRGHEAMSGWGSPECPICGCSGKIYWKGLHA